MVQVVAGTVNGASALDAKEGFVRKRVLLFNDVMLICKAHDPVVDANGVEEYDDTSIEGTNELELILNLDEIHLNLVVIPESTDANRCVTNIDIEEMGTIELDDRGSRQKSPSQRRFSARNKSLVFEITEYKTKSKREMRLHFKTSRIDVRDRWVEELESMLLLNRMGTPISERPGWYYTLIKDGFSSSDEFSKR